MDIPIEVLEAIDMGLDDQYKNERSTLLETVQDTTYRVVEFVAYLLIVLGSLAIVGFLYGLAAIWLALKTLEFLVIQFPLGG